MADGLRYLVRAAAAAIGAAVAACGGARGPAEPAPDPAVGSAGASSQAAGWRSCLLDGASPCISEAPIRVGSELIAWSNWIADHAEQGGGDAPVTECRWVAELEQVLLCGNPDKEAMNPPLTRISIFVENKPRVVVPHADPLYRSLLYRIGGHDLMRRHPRGTHPDMTAFYAALDAACAKDRTICGDESEQAMRALLERAWVDKPSFVLLTFAHHGGVPDDEAVSHEILHAQYFTDPKFRAAIDDYWTGLGEGGRAAVRAHLGTFYNPKDDELMANELMAYVLMSGAEQSRFGMLVDPYGPALAKLLASRGIKPIAVQRRTAPAGGELGW